MTAHTIDKSERDSAGIRYLTRNIAALFGDLRVALRSLGRGRIPQPVIQVAGGGVHGQVPRRMRPACLARVRAQVLCGVRSGRLSQRFVARGANRIA